jgi:RNA polymerase sigma-70 factor (ECF subfamily)
MCVSIWAAVRLICAAMAETAVRIAAAEPEVADRERRASEVPPPAPVTPSFDGLLAEHRERVARLCYRLLGWREDIQDVVQDVFVAAFRALPGFRRESGISTWLTRITVNTCRSHMRKRLPRLRLFAKRQADSEPCLGRSPDGELMDRERFEQVRAAIGRLPVKYREVVVLRYLEELKVSEVGNVLGLGKNAVEVRLNRARKWLKEDLAEILEGSDDERRSAEANTTAG